MQVLLKENIIFCPYYDKKLMREAVLDFVFNSKTNKILYKGDPMNINYKLLKKILPLNQLIDTNNSITSVIDIKNSDDVKTVYVNFLKKMNCSYCIIHKK